MTALEAPGPMSIEEYLEIDRKGTERYEYAGGYVYDMGGASEAHNLIATNITVAIHAHLSDRPCKVFQNDMKVRVDAGEITYFYYPDVFVTCDPRDSDPFIKQHPLLVFEVLSPSTEKTDLREKFVNYRRLNSLREFISVHQDRRRVVCYSDSFGWNAKYLVEEEDVLHLPSLDLSIPLRDIFHKVDLPPERT